MKIMKEIYSYLCLYLAPIHVINTFSETFYLTLLFFFCIIAARWFLYLRVSKYVNEVRREFLSGKNFKMVSIFLTTTVFFPYSHWKCNFAINSHVRLLVGWLVVRFVIISLLVTIICSHQNASL